MQRRIKSFAICFYNELIKLILYAVILQTNLIRRGVRVNSSNRRHSVSGSQPKIAISFVSFVCFAERNEKQFSKTLAKFLIFSRIILELKILYNFHCVGLVTPAVDRILKKLIWQIFSDERRSESFGHCLIHCFTFDSCGHFWGPVCLSLIFPSFPLYIQYVYSYIPIFVLVSVPIAFAMIPIFLHMWP